MSMSKEQNAWKKCIKLSYFQTPHFSHLLFVLNDLNGNFQRIKLTPYVDMVMDTPVFQILVALLSWGE
jgi:hypothetical protein